MGSSEGSQFLSEYPGGMRCLRASASVAFAVGAGFLVEVEGREVCVFLGVEDDSRRLRDDDCCAGGGTCSYCS